MHHLQRDSGPERQRGTAVKPAALRPGASRRRRNRPQRGAYKSPAFHRISYRAAWIGMVLERFNSSISGAHFWSLA